MSERRLTRLTLAGFAAFNLAYLAVKLATISAAHYDYAKELYNAQALRWVYDAANPPLYTWLLYGLARIIGPSIEAPLILTHLLLFVTLVAAFALGRRALGSARDGALAGWLLLTLAQVFRIQFARTHSLMLVLFSLLALLAFAAVLREGRWRDYGLLGLALGAGLLSKYAFAGSIATLVLGALATREGRRALATPRIALTLAALLALLLPVALAGADQWAALAEIFKTTTAQAAPPGRMPARLGALVDLVGQVVVFGLVPVLAMGAAVAAGLVGRRGRSEAEPDAAADAGADAGVVRLLAAMMLAGLAILVVGVLGGFVARVSERFLLAFLLPLPFVLAALARRQALGRAGLRRCAAAIAAVLLVQAGVRILDLSPYCSGKCTDLTPYDRLGAQLRAAGLARAAVTTANVYLAGNIVAALPETAVSVRDARGLGQPRLPSRPRCLIIWRADTAPAPPLTLVNASGLAPAEARARARVIRVPWRWVSRNRFRPFAPGARRSSSWGTISLMRGEGSCR